jgi:hypothetical protein
MQGVGGLLGERGDPLFAAFAECLDVRCAGERDVAERSAVSSETRSPVWMASVMRAWSQRPIQRAAVGCGEQRLGLGLGEVADDAAVVSFGRDRQHARDRRRVGMAEGTHGVVELRGVAGKLGTRSRRAAR